MGSDYGGQIDLARQRGINRKGARLGVGDEPFLKGAAGWSRVVDVLTERLADGVAEAGFSGR